MSRGTGSGCALVLIFASASAAQTVVPGSFQINPANNHGYYLLTQSSWEAAEAAAVQLGGHLVTINNANEDNWVYQTYGSFGGVPRSLWIGLNDAAAEGVYVWTSGESTTYTHWAFGEPNNLNNEDYIHIFEPGEPLHRSSYWNDNVVTGLGGGAATLQPHGVVEVVPEPSTMALLLLLCLLICRNPRRCTVRV